LPKYYQNEKIQLIHFLDAVISLGNLFFIKKLYILFPNSYKGTNFSDDVLFRSSYKKINLLHYAINLQSGVG